MMTSPELAIAAMQLRKAHPSWGPKKVVAVLARQYPGRVDPVGVDDEPYLAAGGVQDADAPPVVGRLSAGAAAVLARRAERPLDRVLAMRGMTRTRTEDVRPVFEELFDRYGLPKAIHSDNGPPFASLRGPGGLTQLSAWWVSLGIQVVRSRPVVPGRDTTIQPCAADAGPDEDVATTNSTTDLATASAA